VTAGDPFWNDEDGYGYRARLLALQDQYEREGLGRDWHSQYQCRPRPPEGVMFRPGELRICDVLPPKLWNTVRAWDLASTTSGDWTVGLRMSHYTAGNANAWVITDVRRIRGRPDEVRKLVRDVADADGYGTEILLPEDPGQAGKDQSQSYVRDLVGFRVEAVRMSGSKEARADAVASQVNIGAISMLRAPWNAALIDELGAFPLGRYDDQVDALSLAFSKLDGSGLATWLRYLE